MEVCFHKYQSTSFAFKLIRSTDYNYFVYFDYFVGIAERKMC